MRFSTFALLTSASTVVNAHFQLAYPAARGPFNAKNEVNFCDNYVDAVDNRTEFPVSGGYVTLRSGHPNWSFAMSLSTVQDPTSFDNFTNSTGGLVRNFATGSGAGNFCIPLDLSNTGISGVSDGANVTIQFIYNGGDGSLYQCADLTLAQNFSVPSNVSCANVTSPTNTTGSNTTNGNGTDSKSGASGITATGYAGALGFLIALLTA